MAWYRGKRFLPVTGYWNRVIFSDESKIEIGTDNRLYVWRRTGEEWLLQCTAPPPTKKFGVMLYGWLVAWLSGRTSVFGRRTFFVLRSTCCGRVTTYVNVNVNVNRGFI